MGALKSYKCSKGHRMVPSNLYIGSNGLRQCKKCAKARAQAQFEASRKLKPRKSKAQRTDRSGGVAQVVRATVS
jgi:hypothetical protein